MTQDYYGTKRVTAWRDDRGQPDGSVKPGYGVQYADGYTSWSPAEAFEAAYKPITALDFAAALVALKEGHRLARSGWNGKGMFLFVIAVWTYTDGKQDNYPNLPFIAMKTADDKVVPWLASQTDILAADWQIAA